MRISDWSSDVCSSDLDGHRPPDRPFARRGGATRHRRWRHRRPRAPYEPARRRTQAASRRGAGSRTDRDAAVAARDSPDQGERIAGRSEEHTSELQSLMRISYAVFCLKKKNKKRKKTTT